MLQHEQVMLIGNINNNAQIELSFVVAMPQQQCEGITSLTMLNEIQARAEVARGVAAAAAGRAMKTRV